MELRQMIKKSAEIIGETAQIVTDKGYLPIKEGDLIWKRSEVKYDSDGFPDPKSADYTVKGVADEGLTVDLFLLQRNVK